MEADSDFRKEQQRLEILTKLEQEYRRYHAIRAKSLAHDDAAAAGAVVEILKLESRLRQEFGQPYALQEQKYREGEILLKAEEIWKQAEPIVAQLQLLSARGETKSNKYSNLSNQLETLGVRFACLFSDQDIAAIVQGGEGMVHRQIRDWAGKAREEGLKLPARPDVSGHLIRIPGSKTWVMRLDNPQVVWTSHLRITFEQGTNQAYAPVMDTDKQSMGEALLASSNLETLSARSTSSMQQLQEATANKWR